MTTEQGRKCCEKCWYIDTATQIVDRTPCIKPACDCHTKPSWEKRFDNGVALKIGNAGKSEGIQNVRLEIKSFFRTEITRAENELAEKIAGEIEGHEDNDVNVMVHAAMNKAAAIARSFIRNDEGV